MTAPRLRRVVLVGFMGSGKSSVGRILAESLGWDFVDLDAQVEAAEGRTVPAIFAESGEPFFRAVEAREAEEILARDRVVLAAGGGWGAHPGRLRSLPEGTRTVWLRVSPEEAVRRVLSGPGARPLLAGADPLRTAVELLSRRVTFYAESDLEVDTEGKTVEDVAARILNLLGSGPGVQPAVETR